MMDSIFKIITVIIVALLLIVSGLVIIQTEENEKTGDTKAPVIVSVTGDIEGTTGKIVLITTTFSDNANVTDATLFYKATSSNKWENVSILSGSAEIQIPSSPVEDIFYYVTVDDAAGNGPVGNPSNDGSKYFTITVTEPIVELSHNVFVEEATGSWCPNCPAVGEVLNDLYKTGDWGGR